MARSVPLICFIDRDGRYTITTNYKVMYSTLLAQPHLEAVYKHTDLLRALWRARPRPKRHIMLVRNPYERLLSFYSDKFQMYAPGPDSPIQASHSVFFDSMGLDQRKPVEELGRAFRATDFAAFVEMLNPRLIRSNLHLIPQSATLDSPGLLLGAALRPFWRIAEFVRMESGLDRLAEMEIDLSIRENPTNHGTVEEHYGPAQLKRVAELYSTDFSKLGYEPRG